MKTRVSVGLILFLGLFGAGSRVQSAHGQSNAVNAKDTQMPQWEIDAGGKMAFDVASVKQNKGGVQGTITRVYSNIPFGDDDAYVPTGGLLSVTNFTVSNFISFAYKLSYFEGQAMGAKLPNWARTDRFDIEARGPANATKNQMRLMMQSLLADRFKLVAHFETHDEPIYNLVLAKAGQLGPHLTPYSTAHSCVDVGHPAPTVPNGSPLAVCGGLFARDLPDGGIVVSSTDVTIQKMADDISILPSANIDRPVIDHTGLAGKFDFTLSLAKGSQRTGISIDDSRPSFIETLQDQLGVKLESATGPVTMLVIDHVEEPSQN